MYGRLWIPSSSELRPERVADHRESTDRFVERVQQSVAEAVARGDAAVRRLGPHLLDWCLDDRMLQHAWQVCRREKGQAPGPNGRRFADVDSADVWPLLRAIREAVRSGSFRSAPPRIVEIPKDVLRPERGVRRLSIPNIEDRVVQTAVLTVLGPLIDRILGDDVYGFRPQRDRRHALHRARDLAVAEGRRTWISQDLRDAFDRVPRGRLRDVVAARIPNAKLVELVWTMLPAGRPGVPQGAPLSPALLNLYLAHHLDEPWRRLRPQTPLLRYADDLLLPCESPQDAEAAHRDLVALLRPTGMTLKAEPRTAIVDLRAGDRVDWLGFDLGFVGELFNVRITERTWSRLVDALHVAQIEPHSPLVADDVVRGWLDQIGPCYGHEQTTSVLHRVLELGLQAGFEELPSVESLRSVWRRARDRWEESGA